MSSLFVVWHMRGVRATAQSGGGSEYACSVVTSLSQDMGLHPYVSTQFIFHFMPLLTCTFIQFMLFQVPNYVQLHGFLSYSTSIP